MFPPICLLAHCLLRATIPLSMVLPMSFLHASEYSSLTPTLCGSIEFCIITSVVFVFSVCGSLPLFALPPVALCCCLLLHVSEYIVPILVTNMLPFFCEKVPLFAFPTISLSVVLPMSFLHASEYSPLTPTLCGSIEFCIVMSVVFVLSLCGSLSLFVLLPITLCCCLLLHVSEYMVPTLIINVVPFFVEKVPVCAGAVGCVRLSSTCCVCVFAYVCVCSCMLCCVHVLVYVSVCVCACPCVGVRMLLASAPSFCTCSPPLPVGPSPRDIPVSLARF